jgi:hypothetical protein
MATPPTGCGGWSTTSCAGWRPRSHCSELDGFRAGFDEAITCYRQAIALDPKLAAAHNNLGLVFQSRGRLDEAIVCYRQAIARWVSVPTGRGYAMRRLTVTSEGSNRLGLRELCVWLLGVSANHRRTRRCI